MEREFEEEEVSKAVADCAGDKVPDLMVLILHLLQLLGMLLKRISVLCFQNFINGRD